MATSERLESPKLGNDFPIIHETSIKTNDIIQSSNIMNKDDKTKDIMTLNKDESTAQDSNDISIIISDTVEKLLNSSINFDEIIESSNEDHFHISSENKNDDAEEEKLNGGQIAGITVGIIIAIVIVVLLALYILYKRSNISSVSSGSSSFSLNETVEGESNTIETFENILINDITLENSESFNAKDQGSEYISTYDYDYFEEMVFPTQ